MMQLLASIASTFINIAATNATLARGEAVENAAASQSITALTYIMPSRSRNTNSCNIDNNNNNNNKNNNNNNNNNNNSATAATKNRGVIIAAFLDGTITSWACNNSIGNNNNDYEK
jgi:hypothetical protein